MQPRCLVAPVRPATPQAARPRPRPDAEIVGGEVSWCLPFRDGRPPQMAAFGFAYALRRLLRHALKAEGTEFRVFVAGLAGLLVLRRVAPSLNLLQAVPGG